MFKKLIILIFMSLLITSCGNSEVISPQEKINTSLKEMTSYEAIGQLIRFDGREETEYTVKQCWQNDGKYRLEILKPDKYNGNYTVFNGDEICQYNPKVKDRIIHNVPENIARNQIFVGSFVKNYFNSENVSCAVAKFDENICTVLEAVIPGGNKYTATEKLWVDNETIKPVKLVIYDDDGNERYTLEFESFEYNTPFEANVFEVTN